MKLLLSILTISLFCSPVHAVEMQLTDQVREMLRSRLELSGLPSRLSVVSKRVYSNRILPEFYIQRVYEPVWIDNSGLKPITDDLISAIKESYTEGLNPADYHLPAIEKMVWSVSSHQLQKHTFNPGQLVDLEILLTDAFITLAAHYIEGKVDPETLDAHWHANLIEKDIKSVLQEAVEKKTIRDSLRDLLPPYSGYEYLRRTLQKYRDISDNGGWHYIPEGPTLRQGDMDDRVPALRERLILTGSLDRTDVSDIKLYDDQLYEAVENFQRRHGLKVDGAVGSETLSELNVPVENRIKQIRLNMERWRWLPQDLGWRYLIVNIANYEVELIEYNSTVLNMRAVVGRPYRTTPVFSSTMTYLVFSPFWNIPPGITRKDIIPEVKKDPGYLKNLSIKILDGWGAEEREINPYSIDWNRITARNFPYRFRQDPGPDNPLGSVKFMFPNRFDVYIHDTSHSELFDETVRNFSSGCIRIDKPFELAAYLLKDDPEWTKDAIRAALRRETERTVRLPSEIPVHILYWTAWTTEDGTINFRRDIYNRDDRVYQALISRSNY